MRCFLKKSLSAIIGLAVFGLLIWYLYQRWDDFKVLGDISAYQLFFLYLCFCLVNVGSAAVTKLLVGTFGARPGLWDMVLLQNASVLLNYVPMKFGTVFKANYLKRHYRLLYSQFAAFFMYITVLMVMVASMVGLVILALVYGLGEYQKILAAVFILMTAGSLIFIFVPLSVPEGTGKISEVIKNFILGRQIISARRDKVALCIVIFIANFLITTFRFYIIYRIIGQDIHWGGCVILGAVGFVIMFMSLTPGSLGIKELVLGCGAVVLGVPLELGVLAALIDRAVTFSYSFVVGGACVIRLWMKSPADFKTRKKTEINREQA